jgi:hypothetical protein
MAGHCHGIFNALGERFSYGEVCRPVSRTQVNKAAENKPIDMSSDASPVVGVIDNAIHVGFAQRAIDNPRTIPRRMAKNVEKM